MRKDNIYLHRGTSNDPNIKYLTGMGEDVDISDKFYIIKYKDKIIALIGRVDKRKLEQNCDLSRIITFGEYSNADIRGNIKKETNVLTKFLNEYKEYSFITGPKFPSYIFNQLSDKYDINSLSENPISQKRKIKTKVEIEKMRSIQQCTERGMKYIEKILKESDVNDQYELVWKGNILTSSILRKEVENFFDKNDSFTPYKYIIATGKDSSDPHNRGKGPIRAQVPIIVDIFPYSKYGYYGDMSRTFIKGEPSQKLQNMNKAVNKSLNAGLEIIEDGIEANKVHDRVCEVIEKHGYETGVNKESGFIHSTGHSIGLELHENPRISGDAEKLKENMILTIEPGLYYEDIGGIRTENMIRVTEDGYEDFNTMSKNLICIPIN